MKVTSRDLIIGTRYWLDKRKDVSGVFKGVDKDGDDCFNKIEGNINKYGYLKDGKTVGFATSQIEASYYTLD